MNALEKFIKIMQTEMSKPTLYGGAHLFFLGLTISAIVLVCFKCRKLSDRNFRKILLIIGLSLIILEILKQLNFAYDATTDTITAVKEGTDILSLSYVLADGSTKTFDINVIVKDKTTYTKDITISLSNNNYMYLEYFTDSLKSECEILVIEGDDVVSVVEFEYKHFAIVATKVGYAKIVIDSPTSTNTFYVTVIL